MNVLAIGNSFSHDATRYLHGLAKSCGCDIKTVNLFIGGCSLKTHYYNILDDKRNYAFMFNGDNTGIAVSVKEALCSDDWDYITLQQASRLSPDYETYQPYLDVLAAYVRKYCPHSKLMIHQTWAYEADSVPLNEWVDYNNPTDMFRDIKKSYEKAAKAIEADGIIPCGEVMSKMLELGIKTVHRDGFHADLGAGRFALALTWFTVLAGGDPDNVPFNEFDVPVSDEDIAIAKQAVKEICL
ncbi:MAG: DUF4886 domain-containing protein [Monoglobales bacterium]